ncbi:MAG: methyltransferase domain-containing protein [Silicimonas sp.]|nr:methyltransferase domain-containing protein [Silicimonas sp.]
MTTAANDEERAAGRGYEALFVPALFAPWTTHIIEAIDIRPEDHVLDIACGSGVLARHAHRLTGPSGRVVGLDAAPGMISAASEMNAEIVWIVGSAEDLPFDNASFDHAISQFGIMFFADREEAARETARVLKPRGRFAFAAWGPLEDNPAYKRVATLLDRLVSPAAGDAVRVPFSFSSQSEAESLFREAGFEAVTSVSKTETATFPSPRVMVEAELRGWLPMFGITLDEAEIESVLTDVDSELSEFTTDEGTAEFPTAAYIISGQKPF